MFFRVALVEEGSIIFNECPEEVADRLLPETGSFLKVANDLAAEQPQIVDVFLDGLLREPGFGKVEKERCKALHQFLAGEEIAVIAHPA